jgi:sterol desaturase/sphingolipid hydroxylase (fatty acid hydroxylase superfamily)
LSKAAPNMAETHRGLMYWFASTNPFMVLLKSAPIFVIYALVIPTKPISWTGSLIPFLLGIISWSFFEYAVHRWLYHIHAGGWAIRWFFDTFHLHHHTDMKDHGVLNAGFLVMYPLTALFLGTTYLITQDFALTCNFGLGMTLYYIFYESVHYFIHYRKYTKGYMAFIQKYHLHHHYNAWQKNFGNTVVIWDRLFGTYDSGYKNLELKGEQLEHFIKKDIQI